MKPQCVITESVFSTLTDTSYFTLNHHLFASHSPIHGDDLSDWLFGFSYAIVLCCIPTCMFVNHLQLKRCVQT